MPDLINPDMTGGKKDHIVWKDEICASCRLAGTSCPLIQLLHSTTLLTYSGIHVAKCDLYDPDESSEWYVPPSDMEKQAYANLEALKQQIELLSDVLERANVYP